MCRIGDVYIWLFEDEMMAIHQSAISSRLLPALVGVPDLNVMNLDDIREPASYG